MSRSGVIHPAHGLLPPSKGFVTPLTVALQSAPPAASMALNRCIPAKKATFAMKAWGAAVKTLTARHF